MILSLRTVAAQQRGFYSVDSSVAVDAVPESRRLMMVVLEEMAGHMVSFCCSR